MVTVTPRARFAFLAILQARQVPPRIGVRLAANADGRVEMAFGSAQPGDEIIQNEHTSLLIVERALVDSLREMEIDYNAPDAANATHSGFVLQPLSVFDAAVK
jgi:Fe-S cluster assembly iron-binding protein IscA